MSEGPGRLNRRTPPRDPGAIRAAESQPGANLYDIAWPYPDDQRTPPEAIRGSWRIDSNGELTDLYASNARYRPIVSKPSGALKAYMHAAAKTNKNQWMVEIDPRAEGSFPNIPENFIKGWWYIDKDGRITDKFRPNSQWVDDELRISE